MNRGFTLLELLVGMITAAVIATVCAKILLVGIQTYNYSVRQGTSMTRMREALAGSGSRTGILEASRAAYSFSTVSASSVAVLSTPAAILTNYYVKSGNLYRTKSSSSVVQADGVNTLTLNYYAAANGLVSSTTVASAATMMTAMVVIGSGTVNAQRTYTLYSGALLRNHP
jgi:prepilin-type N-terminal cleavage/methylation domain-containing protein